MPTERNQGVSATDLDPIERLQAGRQLTESLQALVSAVTGVTDEQWQFRDGADRWSTADVVEHLVHVETTILDRVMPRLYETPRTLLDPARHERDASVRRIEADRAIGIVIAGRASLAEAPAPLHPTRRSAGPESVAQLAAARARTVAFLEGAGGLREHVLDHPAMGPLDGYQWLLFIAAHTERHLQQILELQAHDRYPRRPPTLPIATSSSPD